MVGNRKGGYCGLTLSKHNVDILEADGQSQEPLSEGFDLSPQAPVRASSKCPKRHFVQNERSSVV